MNETINREAGDKLKGYRLQKLRLISLMLDFIKLSKSAHIYGATEFEEDVSITKSDSEKTEYILEQDKNYASDDTFTINSETVLNSIVGFLDIWITRKQPEKNLFLTFYSTREIGKEYQTKTMTQRNITFPSKPILSLLEAKDFVFEEYFPAVIKILIIEYEEQYKSNPGKGYLSIIKNLTEEDWIRFFSTIYWFFGCSDEIKLKDEVLEKIKASSYFDHSMEGKEENILSSLLELVESRQSIKDITERFVFASDIKNIFLEISSRAIKKSSLEDPVHSLWDKLEKPNDKRNLKDKIIEACSKYDRKKINNFTRKVGKSLTEKQSFENDKRFLALRYRVYDKCQDMLFVFFKSKEKEPNFTFEESDIDNIMTILNTSSKETIDELSSDYSYILSNKESLEGVILELFDSCYLAFDKKNEE